MAHGRYGSKGVVLSEQTVKTPEIYLDGMGTLSIDGISIPENSLEFYRPIIEKVEGLMLDGEVKKVKVNVPYTNTSSSYELLKVLNTIAVGAERNLRESGTERPTVYWLCEEDDYDALEAGVEYAGLVKLPFKIGTILG